MWNISLSLNALLIIWKRQLFMMYLSASSCRQERRPQLVDCKNCPIFDLFEAFYLAAKLEMWYTRYCRDV
jgi:hypothetical protein